MGTVCVCAHYNALHVIMPAERESGRGREREKECNLVFKFFVRVVELLELL